MKEIIEQFVHPTKERKSRSQLERELRRSVVISNNTLDSLERLVQLAKSGARIESGDIERVEILVVRARARRQRSEVQHVA